jgi:hypothetical protein
VIVFLLPVAVVARVVLVKAVVHVVQQVVEVLEVHHLLQGAQEPLAARMALAVAEQALRLADLVAALITMLAEIMTALITLAVAVAVAVATLAAAVGVVALSQANLIRQVAQVVLVAQPLEEPVVLEHLQVTPIILAQVAVAVVAHRMSEVSAQALLPMQIKPAMVKLLSLRLKLPPSMPEHKREQSQSVVL